MTRLPAGDEPSDEEPFELPPPTDEIDDGDEFMPLIAPVAEVISAKSARKLDDDECNWGTFRVGDPRTAKDEGAEEPPLLPPIVLL